MTEVTWTRSPPTCRTMSPQTLVDATATTGSPAADWPLAPEVAESFEELEQAARATPTTAARRAPATRRPVELLIVLIITLDRVVHATGPAAAGDLGEHHARGHRGIERLDRS